jgi:hypothetical protein
MRLVQEYAERVVVMSEGLILYDGSSSGLFDQEAVLAQANLRRTILHDLVNAIRAAGYGIGDQVRASADLIAWLKDNAAAEGSHG